jgi:hypothetical protein
MKQFFKKTLDWFFWYHDVQNELTKQGIYLIPTYGIHGMVTFIDKERQEQYLQTIKEKAYNAD